MTLDEEFPLTCKRKGVRIYLDPLRYEEMAKHPYLFYIITDGVHYTTFTVSREAYPHIKGLVEERALASLDRYVESVNTGNDTELDIAKLTVRRMYPRAYQDYLGNVWTDDFYNCDTHCIAGSISLNRKDMRDTWLLAAKRVW